MSAAKKTVDQEPKTGTQGVEARTRRIAEIEGTIEQLDRSIALSGQRQRELEAAREPLVLPARVGKDARAQEQLREIDAERARLKQNDLDDQSARSELARWLTVEQTNLSRDQWEAGRAEVRKLLEARLKRQTAANLLKAAEDLANALKKATEEDQQVASTLKTFESGLRHQADNIRALSHRRGQLLAMALEAFLPIDSRVIGRGLRSREVDIEEEDRKYYRAAVDALDGLELIF